MSRVRVRLNCGIDCPDKKKKKKWDRFGGREMQRAKAFEGLKRCVSRRGCSLSHHRAFSAQPNYARYHDDHVQDLVWLWLWLCNYFISGGTPFVFCFLCDSCIQIQVMVEGRTKSRAAILNRPSALNALNTAMVGLCYSSGFCS